MKKLTYFKPIVGDNNAYWTIRYKDVDDENKIGSLAPNADCPLTVALWSRLVEEFNEYYEDWEINGVTEYAFFRTLKNTYKMNADTLERLIEVYDSDIAKPILGRTEKRTYDITNTNDGTSDADNVYIDIPVDDVTDEKPTNKSQDKNIISNTARQTGTETVELSDLGTRPNYESLNGFLDENRTLTAYFINLFKQSFILYRVIKW